MVGNITGGCEIASSVESNGGVGWAKSRSMAPCLGCIEFDDPVRKAGNVE